MEKQILREAFESYLPASVAWRQKEQFSDGVGYNWIDTLKEVADSAITDQQLKNAEFRFPYNTPTTKEGYFIAIFLNIIFLWKARQKPFLAVQRLLAQVRKQPNGMTLLKI